MARRFLHALGCPTVQDLKAVILSNQIKDNPVQLSDVNLAEKIFGPDVSTIKGKTTCKKPPRATSNLVEIPPEIRTAQREVELCIDAFFIHGMPFLSTISKRTFY